MLAAIALVASMGAHWVKWDGPRMPVVIQKGVAVGTPKVDERLIIFMRDGKCASAVRYAGKYGDWWEARRFLRRQMGCRLPWSMPISVARPA